MDNVTDAMYMAFAVLVFVVAFTITMLSLGQVNDTVTTIISGLDNENYYDSLVLNDLMDNDETTRTVGVDSIIPTLYRYYKESFSVKILDTDGTLLQYFDTTTEGEVMEAKSTLKSQRTSKQNALISLYDISDSGHKNKCYMFGAPWLGSINKDAKTRIDMYIYGGKGYINNVLVDYTDNNLMQYNDKYFKETYAQYAYEGDTITDENDELVTLTGSKQVSTKIVITYQILN
jgi:hypothetical protein